MLLVNISKHINFALFFISTTIFQPIITGKGIVPVYKHTQCNWTWLIPSTKVVLPPRSAYCPQYESTNYFSDYMIALNQPSSVSNLITINQVDSAVKNEDDSHIYNTKIRHVYVCVCVCVNCSPGRSNMNEIWGGGVPSLSQWTFNP